jgi:hypothetical protein
VPPEAGDDVQQRAVAGVAFSATDGCGGFVPLASVPVADAAAATSGGADALPTSAWLALLDGELRGEEAEGEDARAVTHTHVALDDAVDASPPRAAAPRAVASRRVAVARAHSPDLFSDSEEEEEAAPAVDDAEDVEVAASPPAVVSPAAAPPAAADAAAVTLFAAAKAQLRALAALWADPCALACEVMRCDPFLSELAALCA